MHVPKSVRANKTPEIHWNFEIQMNYIIQTRRPNLVLLKKKRLESEQSEIGISNRYQPGYKTVEIVFYCHNKNT